jgi:NitT/TauT family transport system permease protein
MPYFFGSLKVAITLAFVGSVVSETVASNNGLGQMMSQAQSQFNVPLVFAGLFALAVEGIVMYAHHGLDRAPLDPLGASFDDGKLRTGAP